MTQLLLKNWLTILYILLAIAVVIYMVVNKKMYLLRSWVHDLMVDAEEEIKGDKKGMTRLTYVVNTAYDMMVPPWMKFFISRDRFRCIVKKWYDDIKRALEYTPTDKQCITTGDAVAQTQDDSK